MLAETASAEPGGSKAQWIDEAARGIEYDFPALKALVWFNVAKEADWRVDSSSASLSAFRNLALSPYFNPSAQRRPSTALS